MGLTVRDHLPVEVGHLLHEVMVLVQNGTVRTNGEGVLVAGYGIPRIVGGRFAVLVAHDDLLCLESFVSNGSLEASQGIERRTVLP